MNSVEARVIDAIAHTPNPEITDPVLLAAGKLNHAWLRGEIDQGCYFAQRAERVASISLNGEVVFHQRRSNDA